MSLNYTFGNKEFWLSYFERNSIDLDELGLEKDDDPSSKYQTKY
jgi:hypothetical protein